MYRCPIEAGAEHTPNNIAIQEGSHTLTYEELHTQILKARQEYQDIKKKERVAFSATTTLDTIINIFALLRIGAICCPLNARFHPDTEKLAPSRFIQPPELYSPALPSPSLLSPDAIAFLLYTSGTTAAPKIAALSIDNMISSALGTNRYLQLDCDHRWLLSLPLHHVGGLSIIFRTFLAKATLVMPTKPLFTDHDITHLSLVPTQLYRLLDHKPTTATILLGGAPISPSFYTRALEKNLNLYATYGLTEMSSQVTIGKPSLPLTLGTVLPHREMKLSSDGEILVKGRTLFQGYWTKEEGLSLPLDNDGWFATNDRADENLVFQGRKDRLFISSGENVQPQEIENALLSLPGIIEAHIIPIDDDEYGKRPIAFIRQNKRYTLNEIRDLLSLPKFKLPTALYDLDELHLPKSMKPSYSHLTALITD